MSYCPKPRQFTEDDDFDGSAPRATAANWFASMSDFAACLAESHMQSATAEPPGLLPQRTETGVILALSGDFLSVLGSQIETINWVETPTRANGWYSKTEVHPADRPPVFAELVHPVPDPRWRSAAPEARLGRPSRAEALTRLGAADCRLCMKDQSDPSLEVSLDADQHFDPLGRLDLGAAHDLFQSAEWPIRCEIGAKSERRARRIQTFGKVKPGEVVCIWSELHRDRLPTGYLVSMRSWMKPVRTGLVIAVAETVLRVR